MTSERLSSPKRRPSAVSHMNNNVRRPSRLRAAPQSAYEGRTSSAHTTSAWPLRSFRRPLAVLMSREFRFEFLHAGLLIHVSLMLIMESGLGLLGAGKVVIRELRCGRSG